MMYVVGGGEENEVLLYSVVLCLRDALGILLKCVFFFFSSFLLYLSLSPPSPLSLPFLPWLGEKDSAIGFSGVNC